MTYADLDPATQASLREMVQVFNVQRMLSLNKMEIGEVVADRVDEMGQDGRQFVHYVYNVSVREAGLDPEGHKFYLLRSFLSNICKSILRTHGYSVGDGEHAEVAEDLILRVAQGELQ